MKDLQAGAAILVFAAGDHRHAVPAAGVEKVEFAVELTALPDAPRLVAGVINWRGTILPVLSMRRRLGLRERPVSPDDRLVVVRSERRMLALLVDDLVGVALLSERDIAAAAGCLPEAAAIAGAVTIDADVALIHDIDRFLNEDDEAALATAMAEIGSPG